MSKDIGQLQDDAKKTSADISSLQAKVTALETSQGSLCNKVSWIREVVTPRQYTLLTSVIKKISIYRLPLQYQFSYYLLEAEYDNIPILVANAREEAISVT